MTETKVRFNLESTDSDERDTRKKSDIVKSITLKKVHSDGDTEAWKISSADTNTEKNNEGIAGRTRSKLNMSDQKPKSALRQRAL